MVSIIGNFTMIKSVDLGSNELVVFEEGVFKEILQQMVLVKPNVGYVSLYNSIIFNTYSSIRLHHKILFSN